MRKLGPKYIEGCFHGYSIYSFFKNISINALIYLSLFYVPTFVFNVLIRLD